MSVKHKSCDALLVLYLWMAVAARIEGCSEQGWFGPNCIFKCHCAESSTCDKVSGECGPNKQCSNGWFGPGCQYEECSLMLWLKHNPSWLADHNTSTCNPDSEAIAMTVNLAWPFRIAWIRIQTDIDMSGYDMKFDIGGCLEQNFYRISETTFDLTCYVRSSLVKFHLRGKAVGHICDIKISGGRNLALRQQARQSSDFTGLDRKYVQASNAVDGSREQNSCTQTNPMPDKPFWSIEFPFECFMTRVVFYKSIKHRDRMADITVTIYNFTSKTYSMGYSNRISPDNFVMIFFIGGIDRGNRLVLSIPEAQDFRENFLSLCEAEVFGDIIPKVGKWGLSGKESCKCGPHERCSQVTGACTSPCFLRGQVFNATTLKCAYPCRTNCVGALCQGKGDCPLCQEEQCQFCQPGFSGAFCKQDCPKGMFGENCTSQCSSNCSDSLCNSVSGDCLACPENRVMPLCILKAPPKKDKEKDPPKRDKEKEKEFDYSYLFSLVALLPVLFCLFCCLCGKRRAKAAEDTKNPEDEGAVDKPLSAEHLSQTGSSVDS